MEKVKLIGIGLAFVVLVIGALLYLDYHVFTGSLSTPMSNSSISTPNLPTQAEISSILPNWKIVSLGEINSSQVLNGIYPDADALYQEYLQEEGNNQSIISILILHFPGQPNASQQVPHTVIGHYVIMVNGTGISNNEQLAILNLAREVFVGHNGTSLTLPNFFYPSTSSLPLVEYVVAYLNTSEGQFTQYSVYYLSTGTNSGESVGVNVVEGNNSTQLYNYLYSTTKIDSNQTQSGPESLATNGTFDGARYFNISTTGPYGSTYYFVALKGNYVVLTQSQPLPDFQLFEYIITKL
ncbi:hypothetical protein [Metallosphaera sp.]|uniref:hypothetical protein n=1 Tax=Metallosphaera sp. TaxID=2020860 RepID=UPI003161DC1D